VPAIKIESFWSRTPCPNKKFQRQRYPGEVCELWVFADPELVCAPITRTADQSARATHSSRKSIFILRAKQRSNRQPFVAPVEFQYLQRDHVLTGRKETTVGVARPTI